MGLGKVTQNLSGRDHVVRGRNCQSGSAVQVLFQTFKAQLLRRKADQGVLDDHILNACFTQLTAELGIILNVDALVIDQHAGRRILDLLYQRRNQSLLLFQNLCIRHLFHLL